MENNNIQIIKTPTFTETTVSLLQSQNINTTFSNSKFSHPKRKNISTSTLSLLDIKKIRKDVFGEEIKRGGKHRVSFKDKILILDNNNNKDNKEQDNLIKNKKNTKFDIVEIIDIDSYKEQNKKMFYKSNGEIQLEESVCCESCNIF